MELHLEHLFRHETEFVTIAAGNALFHEGDPGDRMYVLIEGAADIVVSGKVVEHAVPGTLLGEMTLVDGSPRSATVVARENCKLVPIDVHRFQFLIRETPHFAIHVMRVIANRLRSTDKMI